MAYSHDGTNHPTPSPVPMVTHRALCPACGRFAERESFKPFHHAGVHVSLYACPQAHLWQTQWSEVA